ncbi:uncharacterized protein LODBEIA_P56730 [Lodderomyces beijingensis]|uniref:ER membrane protein complex subunit 1 n=1 Tax=Lodderomyces beijingensis TaxID=1775926 RepID=A0ABP0ZU82_9ASCO
MKSSLLGILALVLTVVNSVLVENAFSTSESINYLYQTPLSNIHVLGGKLVVATNKKGQLQGVDALHSGVLRWRLNPEVTRDHQLLFTSDRVYAWSGTTPEILETDNQGSIASREVEFQPRQLYASQLGELFVLDTSSNLHYLGGNDKEKDKDKTLVLHADVSRVDLDYAGGSTHVIVNCNKLLILSPEGEIKLQKDVNLGSIKEFKSGVVITENDQIFKYESRAKNFKRVENNEYNNLAVINSEYLYATSSDGIKIISIAKRAHEVHHLPAAANCKLFATPFNAFLVASNNLNRIVYDMSDFLYTHDAKSIKKIQFKLRENFPLEFLVEAGGEKNEKLGLLFLNDDLVGELVSLLDGERIKIISSPKSQASSRSHQYLLIDQPKSKQLKDDVELFTKETDGALVFTHWIQRTLRHLRELGHFVVHFKDWYYSDEVSEAFDKLVVFYEEDRKSLVALHSHEDAVFWDVPLTGQIGDFITIKQVIENDAPYLVVLFANSIHLIDPETGVQIDSKPVKNAVDVMPLDVNVAIECGSNFQLLAPLSEDVYLKKIEEGRIAGHVIPKGSTESIETWSNLLNEPIIKVESIPSNSKVSTVGIPLHDKSVIYKYLNPNLISVLTFEERLKLYLIDGISGDLLYTYAHPSAELVDPESINLVMDDNWLVYTFFTYQPRLEQRINAIDLFNSKLPTPETTNSTIAKIYAKSFIYPERILEIASTQSNHGITLKSIVAFTESGNLIELPKFVLNSRRPEHQMQAKEYQDDFRLMPYDPVIPKNNYQTLNHKYKLDYDEEKGGQSSAGKIMIRPTAYESTAVVCFYNDQNQFCTIVQPSSSFDLLGKKFEKLKLVGTIIVLLIAYIATKPYVADKKLKSQWLDYRKK